MTKQFEKCCGAKKAKTQMRRQLTQIFSKISVRMKDQRLIFTHNIFAMFVDDFLGD